MSQTKCQLVQIDLCKYNYDCSAFDTKASKCIFYLNSVTKYSGVNISHGNFFSISQANGKWNIFIFSNNAPIKTNEECSIGIRLDKVRYKVYKV